MVRTMQTLKKAPVRDWSTSTQIIGFSYDCRGQELWELEATAGSKRTTSHGATMLPRPVSSPIEDALQQLPTHLRIKLVDGLTEGGDAGSGKQATLASARLCCKALRRVVDDGLRSLRMNVLPDVAQGPAPSLSGFPNVHSLTLSIDASWKAPKPDDSSQYLLPGERPEPSLQLRSWKYLYPPSLVLEPLQGQLPQSLHRLRSLTLIGQLTCFRSLCEQLHGIFGAGAAAADAAGPSLGATARSGGAGPVGGAGGCCSLEHLNLGNVRFQRRRVEAGVVAEGHRALAVLGLRELTLGAELLPGLEAQEVRPACTRLLPCKAAVCASGG